jgi:putative endonuclease
VGTREYYVYIMTNRSGTLYTGVTSNLERRMDEHKQKLVEGFTKKYNIDMLVYYEVTNDVREALEREKQVKAWRRSRRLDLIESMNPDWRDLSDGW